MTDWYAEGTATLGDRITAAREAAGLSPAELARRLGVTARTIAAWEDDQSEPRANRMQMLSGLLGVPLRWLMSGAGPGLAAPDDSAPDLRPALAGMRDQLRGLRRSIREAEATADRLDHQIAAALAPAGAGSP
jgi:transcriptional regulator with XRE-family HTH domain